MPLATPSCRGHCIAKLPLHPVHLAPLLGLPQRLGAGRIIFGEVQAAGIAEGLAVMLVLAPEGSGLGATVLAHLGKEAHASKDE
jgi:hypothetical protein